MENVKPLIDRKLQNDKKRRYLQPIPTYLKISQPFRRLCQINSQPIALTSQVLKRRPISQEKCDKTPFVSSKKCSFYLYISPWKCIYFNEQRWTGYHLYTQPGINKGPITDLNKFISAVGNIPFANSIFMKGIVKKHIYIFSHASFHAPVSHFAGISFAIPAFLVSLQHNREFNVGPLLLGRKALNR